MECEAPNFATEENFKKFVTNLKGVIDLDKIAGDVMRFFWSEFARFVGIENFHIQNPRELPTTELIEK